MRPNDTVLPPPPNELSTEAGDFELLEAHMRDRLRIDPMALEEEFIRIPTEIALITGRSAAAIGEHLRAKARAKKMRGLYAVQVRQAILDVGGKPTESQVDGGVEQLPEWQAVQEEEIVAEVAREVAKGHVAAIMAKKDMLVQMGATHRAEMERDPVIKDRAWAARRSDG